MPEESDDTVLDEYTSWARQTAAKRGGNDADVATLLRLMREQQGVADPGELNLGDLDELLLEVYPRVVTVFDAADAAGVIPSARDLLAFLGDTGRAEPDRIERLTREVDELEPRFRDALMDPANWGPVRELAQAMIADGVDVSDKGAVGRWIAGHGADLPGVGLDDVDDDVDDIFEDDFDDDEGVDLAEALGLPDRLPPLRLPPDSELVAAARASGLLRRARELSLWVGERRAITEDGELTATDASAAAQALDIPAAELVRLWQLVLATDLVHVADAGAGTGAHWPSDDEDDDLDTWATALAGVMSSLTVDAEVAGRYDLDFRGAGAVLLMLFLARGEGLPRAELSELVHENATAELPPAQEQKAWQSWVEAHGDPADTMLERLVEHGAVEGDDEVVRLTPLGLSAMHAQLTANGMDIPLLPPVTEMTAADLIAAADGFSEEELAAETAGWLALRSPESAADELLEVAATADPAGRMHATAVATEIGAAAEPRWRTALDQPELRAYAKLALNQLAGAEAPNFAAGLQPQPEDLAWLLTDVLAATSDTFGPEELDEELRQAVPAGQEREIFEVMWRIPHPEVHDVLTLLGTHHPDKKIAKAARTAAFKASSRPD